MEPKNEFSKGSFCSRRTAESTESWRASITKGFSPRAGVTIDFTPGCLACGQNSRHKRRVTHACFLDQRRNVLDDVSSRPEEERMTYHDVAPGLNAFVEGVSNAGCSEFHVRRTNNPRLGRTIRSVRFAYFFVTLVRLFPSASVVDDDHADLAGGHFAVLVRRDARIEKFLAAGAKPAVQTSAGEESGHRKEEHCCPSKRGYDQERGFRQNLADMTAVTSLWLIAAVSGSPFDTTTPWGWDGGMPADVVFVKGKKVAGTTVGGIMRRLGHKHGIDFFSPTVPSRSTSAWRSGGRERWILERFGEFAEKNKKYVAWAQEQTLSPRRAGLESTSAALFEVAQRAWRVTVIREPFAHALSACTHFGPCAVKTVGDKKFANTTSAARMAWIDESLGPAQMWRFITPEPRRLIDLHQPDRRREATRAAAEYYHAILLADDLHRSLVALALSTPGLDLSDVLYIPAKTTHTGRRPPVEKQPEDFVGHLRTKFYDGKSPGDPIESYGDSPRLAADTELYLFARARLNATIHNVSGGPDAFYRELKRYEKMQARMLEACVTSLSSRRHQHHRRSSSSSHRRSLLSYSNFGVNETRQEGAAAYPPRANNQTQQRVLLPGGMSPRAAHECLYGDQGCGYRCIDAWVVDREKRLEARKAKNKVL